MSDRRTSQSIGQYAEILTKNYLEHRGLKWIRSNYRCPSGEIDLIMEDKGSLVFVEVRYRSLAAYGESLETVERVKQRRIIRAAWHYLLEIQQVDKLNCRFDVVGLDAQNKIHWIKNAFEVKY